MKKEVFKVVAIVLTIMLIIPTTVNARRGCCSHHGGVTGSCSNGRQVCADGSISPSCGCENYSYSNSNSYYGNSTTPTVTYVYGCTDRNAINYNQQANISDQSCKYQKEVSEVKKIKYEIKKVDSKELIKGQEEIADKGQDGKEEIIYTIIIDEKGNELERVKKASNIILEPKKEIVKVGIKNETTPEDSDPIFTLVLLICLGIVFIHASNHKDGNLILNKIQKKHNGTKILLYTIYIILVIPIFIDIFLILKSTQEQQKRI